jgi:NADH:ubiquinone oxidoreductase subunit 2 (subunit N)
LADRWGGAIARLKGAASSSTLGAAMFVLFSLSLLGLPPLPGFWSKFLVLGGLANAGGTLQLTAMAIILAGTVLEGAYLMRVITILYKPVDAKATPRGQHKGNLFASAVFAAVLLAAAVLVNPLWQGLNTMAESAADTEGYTETVLKTQGKRP